MTHSLRKGGGLGGALIRSLCALLPVVSPASAAAQTRPFQTPGRAESPLVLRLPASPRSAALANVGIASADADALFYNPAMLVAARGVAMSVQRYGSQATAGSFASVQAFGPLSVAVGAQFLDYGTRYALDYVGAVRAGAVALADGGSDRGSSTALSVGVARTVRGVRAGATVKYVEDRLANQRDGGAAIDVGMSRPIGFGSVAVALQNIGAGLTIAGTQGRLPTRFTVGYGGGLVPLGASWDIGVQTQIAVERDGFVRPAGGLELAYVPIEGVAIVLRQGLRLPRERDEPLITAGLGFTLDRFSLDYAAEPMRGGRPVSHRVGIRLR